MGIKGMKISVIVSISFDTEAIPRLNPQQREQAIGRLHAGQPARVIANGFNCNVRTIERLKTDTDNH
jgi:DNA invertase Pin-like site-specific DNA recombinase